MAMEQGRREVSAALEEWEADISRIAEQGVKAAGCSGEAAEDLQGLQGESLGQAFSHAAEWMKDKATSPWAAVKRSSGARRDSSRRKKGSRHREVGMGGVLGGGTLQSTLGSLAVYFGLLDRRRLRRSERRERSEGRGGRSSPAHKRVEDDFEIVDPSGEDGGEESDLPALGRYRSEPVREKAPTEMFARHSSFTAQGAQDDRLREAEGPPDMQWICLPYYLASGYMQLTFVTDKARNMSHLTQEQKLAMLIILALSVCNFVSTTTTAASNLPFKILRSFCDAANIVHSLVLIMISVWMPRLAGERVAFCQWLSDFTSISQNVNHPSSHVCAYIGILSLLLGLVRVASDLSIDVTPKLGDLPITITGMLLILLIPANVIYRTEHAGSQAVSVPEIQYSKACRSGGWGVCLFVLEEGRWCACHVLTSSLALALIDLGAPTQRKLGLPLVAMILTSLWGLAVAAAGIILGPEALPWPGMMFFALLPVACILLSKHL